MKEKLNSIFDENIPDFPKQIPLQLPKLKKIGEDAINTPPKLQLPKLKKVEI